MAVMETDLCIYILPVMFPLYRSASDTGGEIRDVHRAFLFSSASNILCSIATYARGGTEAEVCHTQLHTNHRQMETALLKKPCSSSMPIKEAVPVCIIM